MALLAARAELLHDLLPDAILGIDETVQAHGTAS
jgi:hypothetical protein